MNVLSQAQMEASEIDEVVLMGGSSRIPKLRQWLSEFFGKPVSELRNSISEDEGVAIGATIMAAILTGQKQTELIVNDVLPISLGIRTALNRCKLLINKGSNIPC